MREMKLAAAVVCAMAVWAIAQTTAPATQEASVPTTRPLRIVATQPTSQAAPSTEPSTQPDFPDPDALIKQLSSPDWHERRKAQDLLVRLGEPARDYIQGLIRRSSDDEARKNAQAALTRIAENRILGPSYITLHVRDAAAADVFARISRQCYAPLPAMPDNLWQQGSFAKVSIDADHEPFWEVVPKVCQQVGVDFRPFQYGMRLMRTGGMQTQGITSVEGAFVVIANQITYNRTRLLGQGQAEHTQFGLNLSVYPEPKITVLRGSGGVQLDEALDDHGNSLLPPQNAQPRSWGGFMGFGWNLYVPLQFPRKNAGTKIVSLKGNTSFMVQTKVRTLQIPDILSLHSTTQTIHGMEVTFEEVKKQDTNYELKLNVAHPNFGSPEWPQLMEQTQTRLRLEDAAGNPLDHRGMNTTANNNSIELTVTFARGPRPDGRLTGEPSRLVWDIPIESKEITVPIRFKDLPLFDDK